MPEANKYVPPHLRNQAASGGGSSNGNGGDSSGRNFNSSRSSARDARPGSYNSANDGKDGRAGSYCNSRDGKDGGAERSMGNSDQKQNAKRQGGQTKLQNWGHLSLETTDFLKKFHAKLCRAKKYKVHYPNCACKAVVKLRQRHESPVESEFDVDGNFPRKLSQLNLKDKLDSFDNLVVVPDMSWQSVPAVFVCTGTNVQRFQRDGFSCEEKLAEEILFGNSMEEKGIEEKGIIPPLKVSCASCLLLGHQRNGFVAFVSESLEELHTSVQRARNAAVAKVHLHSDHAHFICALEVSTLQALLKDRKEHNQFKMKVLTQMKEGGVELPQEAMDLLSSKETSSVSSLQIKMGHHLRALLPLFKKLHNSGRPRYVMVIGYIDGPTEFELDLPGGKRHLGESALEGAVREVEEECSLQIDKKLMVGQVIKKYGGLLENNEEGTSATEEFTQVLELEKHGEGNVFFVLRGGLLTAMLDSYG